MGIASADLYVRRNGETSKATAAEFDALLSRAAGAVPALPQLTVEFMGSVEAFALSEEDFMVPIDGRVRELEDAFDRAARADRTSAAEFSATTALGLGLGHLLAQQQFDPEDRTEAKYRTQIANWRQECAAHYQETAERLIPYAGQPGFFRLTNASSRYLTDIEVNIHVPGNVFGYDPEDGEAHWARFVPRPPRKWGPMKRPGWGDLGSSAYLRPTQFASPYLPSMPASRGPQARLDNSGSIDVRLTVPELRPTAEVDFDDEWVLAWKGPDRPDAIKGRWTATALGLDAVLEGAFEIRVGRELNMADIWAGTA